MFTNQLHTQILLPEFYNLIPFNTVFSIYMIELVLIKHIL